MWKWTGRSQLVEEHWKDGTIQEYRFVNEFLVIANNVDSEIEEEEEDAGAGEGKTSIIRGPSIAMTGVVVEVKEVSKSKW